MGQPGRRSDRKVSLPKALQERLADLEFLDRTGRIDYLIGLGDEFKNPSREEFPRREECHVQGCESMVYVGRDPQGQFRIAIDNPQGISAMAMATIVLEDIVGADPEQIRAIPEDVVYRIFGNELSMGKSLGLTGMVRLAKAALAPVS